MAGYGSHRNSLRREQRSIERGLREYSREVGDYVHWYEFDAANSSQGDTFGEGPIQDPFDPTLQPTGVGRTYKSAKIINFITEVFQGPQEFQTDGGYYTINTATLKFSTEEMRRAGLHDVADPDQHLNDRFFYNGFLYRVESYAPRGYVGRNWFPTLDVMGHELRQADLEDEPDAPDFEAEGTSTPWTPGQQLGWPVQQPTDVENQP